MKEEADWQLYHNWRLRIPDDMKNEVEKVVLSEGRQYITSFIAGFDSASDQEIEKLVSDLERYYGNTDISPDQISYYVKKLITQLNTQFGEHGVSTAAKQNVKDTFEKFYNLDAFKVSALEFAKNYATGQVTQS